MNTHYDTHMKKNIVTIHPGEFYACTDDIFISTVLGSCISVAFYESKLKLGGLNHFMLPTSHRANLTEADEGRFGNYAMEKLLNDMYVKGAQKKYITAKVFGGSNVLDTGSKSINLTGIKNINFALEYLNTEKIPIVANDTGGIFPRKIFFQPQTAQILLKRIKSATMTVEKIKEREKAYQNTLKIAEEKAGEITWF